MLKNFLYLNERILSDYLSALEGGVRQSVNSRTSSSGTRSGKAGVGGVGGAVGAAREQEEAVLLHDSAPARFQRLLDLAEADPEATAWISVLDPDSDLEGALVGALIDVEADLEIPGFAKIMAPESGLLNVFRAYSAMSSSLPGMNGQTIDPKQLDMAETISGMMKGSLVVVARPDSDTWSLAGPLQEEHMRVAADEIDGDARIVGKVKKVLRADAFHPLLALPGMNALPRDKRRELERQGPAQPDDPMWLPGPALMLDILAIYR
jgi:hypothetical protein